MRIRSYREMSRFKTLEERFEYLSLRGQVGQKTFGHERFLNQEFYTSREWRRARHQAIARDLGCDLGVEGHEIYDRPIVHHINSLSIQDIEEGSPRLFDLENLITTSLQTHNAIHYGDASQLRKLEFVERRPGDTDLW